MKKFISALLVAALALSLFTGCGKKEDTTTIYVYNWGQYIAEGDDDSIDVIAEFEKKYPNIKVQYSTFDSNETMYAKLKNGGITVDVVIPSDYMIGRMRQEGMLQELNYDNIPNAQYIDDAYRGLSFDPEDKYSVPYTWGTVGIIYNSKYVDEADVTGWELLWNEKYAGKILMFDNSRDAFGIAEYLLGYSVNTTDSAELQACADKLAEQKPVVQQYVMDQIFDAMENEEAYIAPYYAGDYLTMVEENPDLKFYQLRDPHLRQGEGGCRDLYQLPAGSGNLRPESGLHRLLRGGDRGQAVSGPGAGVQPCSLPQPGDSAQRDLLRLPPRGYLPGDGEPVYDRAERLT